MRWWSQASHCSTCPPSAAVRQRSMALMTRDCPRPSAAPWVCRKAGPKRRKISATSSGAAATAAAQKWAGGVGGGGEGSGRGNTSKGLVVAHTVVVAIFK
jgi:hypothetical protein